MHYRPAPLSPAPISIHIILRHTCLRRLLRAWVRQILRVGWGKGAAPLLMLRLGLVDFDSSHSIEFTRRLNQSGVDREQWVEGARVVLGCPGTSLMSPERIAGFAAQVQSCGVQLVERPEDMLGRIDGVLILSVCGQAHLERVRPFLQAGVPAFVDKPFACSHADAAEMCRLAAEHRVLLFSSSGMRYAPEIAEFRSNAFFGALSGCMSYGPAKRAEGNPGLFHYGIHPVEVLFALMGTGCVSVSTAFTEGAESATGLWRDGRIGAVRGQREGSTAYGFLAFTEHAVVHRPLCTRYTYRNLCRNIVESFSSGQPAVPLDATLEIVQFILASSESERQQGRPVPLAGAA